MHLKHGATNGESTYWIFISEMLEKVHYCVLLKGKEIN